MRIERTRRFGLVLAYAVMTVWVQGGHRHGHEAASETQCDAGCRDPKPHYSGHPSPDLGHAPSDCPACQLRSNLHIASPTLPALGGEVVEAAPEVDADRPIMRAVPRPSSRAPPRA